MFSRKPDAVTRLPRRGCVAPAGTFFHARPIPVLRSVTALALVIGLCVAATSARATDNFGANAVDDDDTKAQCVRLQELCEQAEKRDSELNAATRDVEADASVENIGRYRDAFMDSEIAVRQLHRAAAASVKAQGHAPRCVHECPLLKQYLDRVREQQRHVPKS
ncbi:MAG: hypothetical protein AB7V27_17000 [Candidatus Binatia bacterium]